MQKITTMQKMAGLSLLLCLFTVIIGMFGVSRLSNLAADVEELSSMHMMILAWLWQIQLQRCRQGHAMSIRHWAVSGSGRGIVRWQSSLRRHRWIIICP